MRQDYQYIIKCLKDIEKTFANKSSEEDKKKHQETVRILRAIEHRHFTPHLSGISDLYKVFGEAANVCQTVDFLPHERYDKTLGVIEKFKKMKDCFKHEACVEASIKENGNSPMIEATVVKSAWPRYHEDLTILKNFRKYKNHI